MGNFSRFQLSSVRGKLGAAACAGLITTAVLAGLLLLTAWTASDVVATAQLAHKRVRIYSQLNTAAHAYQGASYTSVREPGALTKAAVDMTRRDLERLLDEVTRVPALNARDREVSRRIAFQGRRVLDQFRHVARLVASVDAVWRDRGSRAALAQVNLISFPIKALETSLQDEIHRADVEMARATGHALGLIRVAVVASLFGLIFALAFSLSMLWLLHTRLRPGLRRLEKGAEAFGAGRLDHRIGFGGTDELARLSTAFDAMAETISEKQTALREIQHGLERSVATRTEELQHANAKLSAADERRRAFLADVSHELRTPLTVIRGETQVALRTADQPGFDPHEVFARILQQTRDLSRMVDDLFLIARAEAGGLPLERRPLDLQDIAARVSGDFETLAAETGGSIRAVPSGGIIASVDPDRVRRALAALIENALRHSQPGVNVEVEVRACGDCAAITVSDDGPGIDETLARELFQRFRRGATRGEGSGLGLSLVNALVEAHGGRAYLEPRAEGGTRAIMQFPLGMFAQAAA